MKKVRHLLEESPLAAMHHTHKQTGQQQPHTDATRTMPRFGQIVCVCEACGQRQIHLLRHGAGVHRAALKRKCHVINLDPAADAFK